MSHEGLECLGLQVSFSASDHTDPILERFADREMIANMRKVFFSGAPTALGHSYAHLMRGPGGRSDLQDIIDLLKAEAWSKRATLTFCGEPNAKVPCINVVQFLVREETVQALYFARGQDVFRKFYADGFCIASMVQTVARGVGVAPGQVRGYIGSGHIYHVDMAAIRQVLADSVEYVKSNGLSGAPEPRAVAKQKAL